MSITSSGQQSTDSLNGKLAFEQDKNRIVGRDEDNLIRLLILADGVNFIMKVAKVGFDALTATDDQLIFNSSQNMFKIVSSGTTSLNTPNPLSAAQVVTATIPHGLSFAPAFMIYVTVPNYGVSYVASNQLTSLPFTFFTYNITPLLYVFGTSDTTNLYIKIANLYNTTLGGLAGTWNFKYYILSETAS